jgi:hypothetical protein
MRTLHFLFCVPVALAPFVTGDKPVEKPVDKAAPAAAPLIPPQVLSPIEGIVHSLAKGAREREVKDLLTALEKLGYPQANHDKLEKSAKDELAKAKAPIDSLPSGAKQLRVTATQLVAIMEKMTDEEAKKELARNILRLDGECAPAHEALGHEKVGKSWVNSAFKDMRVRRGEIQQKVMEASKLEVDMETEENVADEYIDKACGVKATVVRRGSIEFRSNFSVEKTQRIMRELQRALALSYWMRRGGELQLRPAGKIGSAPVQILIDSRDQYKKYAAAVAAAGQMADDDAKLMERPNTDLGSFDFKEGPKVRLAQWEATLTCALLVYHAGMETEGIRTPLTAGHLNWIALSCFGTTLPNYVIKDGGKGYGDTHVKGDEREREELMRLAKAGISGSRTWMQYLAERGEDPSFGNSLVNSLGEIQGNDLHKCTSIVEFLTEAGTFYDPTWKKLGTKAEGSPVTRYTAALGMPFGELETKWREWLLGARPGVQERIDKENLNAWPKDALAVLKYMNEIRENAFKDKIEGVWKLKFDPDLSGPCALHAHYLTLHPEQKKWPDAHEEYADKEGYSVEGSWGGTHSVIAWGGIEDYKESIDLWMGSFYHRLPLVDPGVLRLGWGQEDIYWVMDMSSLAAPYEKPYTVVWPYDGMKEVPTAFAGNEYPDPVPEKGVDVVEAEKFGYPITIQTNPVDEKGEVVDISMRLLEGDKEVECTFSSPSKPSNPEAAPHGAWCLIPMKALRPATEYKVIADWHNSNKKTTSTAKHMEWTFKTQ